MKAIVMAATLAALVSGPALAKSPAASSKAQSAFGSVTSPSAGSSREQAIRECSALPSYPVRDSNMSLSQYRACMMQHGQPE